MVTELFDIFRRDLSLATTVVLIVALGYMFRKYEQLRVEHLDAYKQILPLIAEFNAAAKFLFNRVG